ncbi:MAG: non-ribosomal peptide synthetase [Clostridiales bacterium]|nr:non-ribosomal peptide synthetase [Clostridiales bacterium]
MFLAEQYSVVSVFDKNQLRKKWDEIKHSLSGDSSMSEEQISFYHREISLDIGNPNAISEIEKETLRPAHTHGRAIALLFNDGFGCLIVNKKIGSVSCINEQTEKIKAINPFDEGLTVLYYNPIQLECDSTEQIMSAISLMAAAQRKYKYISFCILRNGNNGYENSTSVLSIDLSIVDVLDIVNNTSAGNFICQTDDVNERNTLNVALTIEEESFAVDNTQIILPNSRHNCWRLRLIKQNISGYALYSSLFNCSNFNQNQFADYFNYIMGKPQYQCDQKLSFNAQPEQLISVNRLEEAFAQIVDKYRTKTALRFENSSITYNELDNAAQQVSYEIKRIGFADGSVRVVVNIKRSPALLAAIIGVLKSGCTYIPIDPNTPFERQAYIMNDSCSPLLISDDMHNIQQNSCLTVMDKQLYFCLNKTDCLDFDKTDSRSDPCIAYIIYTSGSTGKPKGVEVTHKNVISLMNAAIPIFSLSESDKWTLFHSIAFDFSVWEMWGALLTGASLLIVPFEVCLETDIFAELVCNEKITILNQTPTAFSQFAEHCCAKNAAHCLRLIIFGGEPLIKKRLLTWFDHYPEDVCSLVNMFGITETTVHVTYQYVTRSQAIDNDKGVGVALPGWEVSVRDNSGVKLPDGLPGEIWVAGKGLSKGYLKRSELTKQKFVNSSDERKTFYRSGDKGYISFGNLYHLGRLDDQIKLRGYRIELGEIASVIREYPNINEAIVILDNPDNNKPELAAIRAFLVAKGIDFDKLREHLSSRILSYMVPSSFTLIDSIPTNINGKLDIPALLQKYKKEIKKVKRLQDTDKKSNDKELKLKSEYIEVWSEVFSVRVSASDNYFELGGNSLLSVQINSKLKDNKLPEIPFIYFYQYQTIDAIVEKMAK